MYVNTVLVNGIKDVHGILYGCQRLGVCFSLCFFSYRYSSDIQHTRTIQSVLLQTF